MYFGVFFGVNFVETIIMFEISSLKYFKINVSWKIKEPLNFDFKKIYLDVSKL